MSDFTAGIIVGAEISIVITILIYGHFAERWVREDCAKAEVSGEKPQWWKEALALAEARRKP